MVAEEGPHHARASFFFLQLCSLVQPAGESDLQRQIAKKKKIRAYSPISKKSTSSASPHKSPRHLCQPTSLLIPLYNSKDYSSGWMVHRASFICICTSHGAFFVVCLLLAFCTHIHLRTRKHALSYLFSSSSPIVVDGLSNNRIIE